MSTCHLTHSAAPEPRDLTVEAVVTYPQFASLFTNEQIEMAQQRLGDLGYSPAAS